MSEYTRALNDTTPLPALGIWNTRGKGRYPLGANVTATNVDLLVDSTDKVGYEGRQGFAISRSFTNATACYSTGNRMFVIDDGNLKEIFQNFSSVTLATGMGTGSYEFIEVGQRIFVLGAKSKVIDNSQAYDFFVPQPISPTVSVIGGELPAGQYTFAVTLIDELGREGPASTVHVVELTAQGGFNISVVPMPGYTYKAYVSTNNGEVLYELGDFDDNIRFTDDLQFLTNPIDDELVGSTHIAAFDKCAYHDGKLWMSYYDVSRNLSFVFHSYAYRPFIFKPQSMFITIKGEVRSLDSLENALVIGAEDAIYALQEDNLTTVVDYGVPKGSPTAYDDATDKLYLWTTRGVCEMLPFKNLTEEKVSLPSGSESSTAFLDVKGTRRFMVLTDTLGNSFNKY